MGICSPPSPACLPPTQSNLGTNLGCEEGQQGPKEPRLVVCWACAPSWVVRAGVALRSGPFPVLCLGAEALQARLVLRTLPHGPLWKLVTPCEPSHGQNKELEWLPSIILQRPGGFICRSGSPGSWGGDAGKRMSQGWGWAPAAGEVTH